MMNKSRLGLSENHMRSTLIDSLRKIQCDKIKVLRVQSTMAVPYD